MFDVSNIVKESSVGFVVTPSSYRLISRIAII